MILQARRFAAPLFLFLCLLLGGSAQGVWANAILRLSAIALLAWAALHPGSEPRSRDVKALAWLATGAIACALLQLVPIPFSLWASLPGHGGYAEGFELLGEEPGWMPLSLGPYDTIATMLALLPPMAMLAMVLVFRETSRTWLTIALIGGAGAGVLLGILQVSSANPLTSPWYLYRQTNFGVATGFFANGNHMATLLLACIPFIAATAATMRESSADPGKRWAILAMSAGGLAVAVFGLALNGSLAGIVLAIPVLIASLSIYFASWSRSARWLPAIIAASVLGAALFAWIYAPSSRALGAAGSVASRQEIFRNSAGLAADFAPLGSGIGTFEKVYRATEDPAAVDRFYVNHAHNDYIELGVETGLVGVVLILLFLVWWVRVVRTNLGSPSVDLTAVAAAIASATILLHSLVDYPLRTAAISTIFGMCLGIMVSPQRRERMDGELRPTRHLVIG